LAVLTLAAAFGLAEVAMRLAGVGNAPSERLRPPPSLVACVRDDHLGWVFPPHAEGALRRAAPRGDAERTNEYGLRTPEIDEADRDVVRLLVVGDSFAFGWGVADHEAFPQRLDELLRERYAGRRVEVVNAGVPGYSLYQERALLARLLPAFPVHGVVATFSLANDMVDERRVRRFVPDRLADYSPQPLDARGRISRCVAASRVLTWLDLRTRPLQFHVLNMAPGSIRLAEESLEGIVATCREKEVPLLLVVLPRRIEVEASGIERRLGRGMTAGARRMHANLAARHDLPVVDLTPALLEARASGRVFLPGDAHWTPAGHDAAARALLAECAALLRLTERDADTARPTRASDHATGPRRIVPAAPAQRFPVSAATASGKRIKNTPIRLSPAISPLATGAV
jgi:hypothetical protein